MLRWTEPLKRRAVFPDAHPRPHLLGHAAVAAGEKVYFIGGFYRLRRSGGLDPIDMHVFNTLSLRWSDLTPPATARRSRHCSFPCMRFGHVAVLIDDVIYIHGGLVNFKLAEIGDDDDGFCINGGKYQAGTYAFAVDTHRWTKLKLSGDIPEGRWDHSACVLGKAMYVYGGILKPNITISRTADDIYKLDTGTRLWSFISQKRSSPVEPSGHCFTTMIGTKMFVFGYALGPQDEYRYDVKVFDTESNEWLSTPSATLVLEQSVGQVAVAHNRELYLFGGYNREQKHHVNDLWKFNTETFSWRKVHPKGRVPAWKSGRKSGVMVGGDRVVLVGECADTDKGDASHTVLLLLQIFHLNPSLKVLCKQAVAQYGLDRSELPHDIKWELEAMTTETAKT